MTVYYADFDLATGDNDGGGDGTTRTDPTDSANWTNAWQTLAAVIAGTNGTAPAAGDIVYCRGTDALSAAVTVNISGSVDSGYIKFIGVDASGNNVGGSTRAVLDCNGNNINGLYFNGANYTWFENFKIVNDGTGSSDGVSSATAYSYYNVFINCWSDNHGHDGFNGNAGYLRYASYIKCRASNNGNNGFDGRYDDYYFCRSDGNSGKGFDPYDSFCYGCISHDNLLGFYAYSTSKIINCVAHGNSNEGIFMAYSNQIGIGLRGTANGEGFQGPTNTRPVIMHYYGDDNTTDYGGGYYDDIGGLAGAAATMIADGSDTDYGYNDSSTDDYSLAADATGRRIAIEIP